MSLSSLSTEDVARVASEPDVTGPAGSSCTSPASATIRRRIRAPDEAVVGYRAAEKQDLAVGSTLVLADERFRVVGIFRTGNTHDPPILLADEPTGSLDSKAGARILDLLERLRDERELTIVLVTHDASVAARADRIVRMLDGRLDPAAFASEARAAAARRA